MFSFGSLKNIRKNNLKIVANNFLFVSRLLSLLSVLIVLVVGMAASPLLAQNFGSGRGIVDRSSAEGKKSVPLVFDLNRTKNPPPNQVPGQNDVPKRGANFPHNNPQTQERHFSRNIPSIHAPLTPYSEAIIPENEKDDASHQNAPANERHQHFSNEVISVSPDEIQSAKTTVEKPSTFSRSDFPDRKWDPATDPHPSIARIISFDKGERRIHSFGSGTYLQDHGHYGVIITNWHVVRDCAGLAQVHFPNGFTSYAAVMTFDSVWDLAVLLISRPTEIPKVKIASAAPRIGDPLWIAGYGGGKYRLVGGRCTKYLSPADGYAAEFVDVAVDARKGDSGGPIFNQQGELAGVLFGSDNYNTAGSYCYRVSKFLELSKPKFAKIPTFPEEFFAMIEPSKPKHTLVEGSEIFRMQVIRDYKNSFSESSSLSFAASNPRNGRGSSTSREIKAQKPYMRPSSGNGNLSFYPDFPDFYQSAIEVFHENRSDYSRADVRTLPAKSETTHITSKKELIARKNAFKNHAVKDKTTPSATIAYQVVSSGDSSFVASVPNAKYANAAPVGTTVSIPIQENDIPDSQVQRSFHPSIIVSSDEDLISYSQPHLQMRSSNHSGNFFNTLKIIAIIVIVFFVVFHLVKLMSIIEENDPTNR